MADRWMLRTQNIVTCDVLPNVERVYS